MKQEVFLTDLIAYGFLKWKTVLVFMLVIAILMGGKEAVTSLRKVSGDEDVQAKVEQEYQDEIKKYESKMASLNNALAREKNNLEEIEKYMDESPLFTIDPYNEQVAVAELSVSLVNDKDFEQTVEYDTTPVAYMTEKILNTYVAFWNTVNLEETAKNTGFSGIADKYLREIITLGADGDGLLKLRIIGNDTADVKETAEKFVRFVQALKDDVVAATYEHELTLITMDSRVSVDDALAAKQDSYYKSLNKTLENLDSYSKELDKLENNEPDAPASYTTSGIIIRAIKKMIVGAVAGAVLGYVLIVLMGALSDKMIASQEIAKCVGISMLCVVNEKKNIFKAIANAIDGEKTWTKDSIAVEYAATMIEDRFEKGKILITSSGKIVNKEALEKLNSTLTEKGFTVVTLEEGTKDESLIKVLSEVKSAVFFEECGKAKLSRIRELKEICELKSVEIAGVVVSQA